MSHSLLVLLLLASYLPACTSYQVMADPVAGIELSPVPVEKARITLHAGRRFVLTAPYIDGDSLRGLSSRSDPTSVAVADVEKLEVGESWHVPTVLLVLGGLVVAAGLAIGIAAAVLPGE